RAPSSHRPIISSLQSAQLLSCGQRHRYIRQLPAAKDGDQRLLTRAMTLDQCEESILRRCLFAIDRDYGVGLAAIDFSLLISQNAAAMLLADNAEAVQAGSLGRAAWIKRHNLQPAVRDENMFDSRVRPNDLARGNELRHDAFDR